MVPLSALTDEQLAMAYINGDNGAFDLLLDRNKTKLFSYILFVVRNRDVADDIFQDTFVKVIVRLQRGEYRPSGKFSAWLTRIAHNVIMDRFRSLQNSSMVDVDDENDMAKVEGDILTDESVESYFINEQILSDVKHLMECLPPLQREVVFMRYFQEMSFKEIAEATGVSINTSLGRMHYAVNNLRKMVKNNKMELHIV
ncbi:MAG: sigma-70 family RNA polymerase sigma factor [Bacteroidales bacterium]|nr:sigma-70 family RNA polymerase sigma factor [Bacteroidales bacterium]MCM1147909.1 sigma-70 family RNA polymerase sigma factor [Bacteroidales bacterium]MCM1205458.1 sigma-70 family RNA polymerase sigma factor [Bacillota bacterium]